jgi:hypothetical protein
VVKKKKIFVQLVNDIKSFEFGHIQKCPFWPMPLHFRNVSAASEPGTNWETLLRKIFVIFIFVLPMFRYVSYQGYPGVQRFSGVRDLGGDEAEKTSGRDLSNFISMT